MIGRQAEGWRPPLFVPDGGRWASFRAAARRLFDIQARSIWRDLTAIVPQASGLVVDVGCGAQPYRNLVPVTAKYLGIDTTDSKEHFGYEVPGVRYYSGDRWPVADGCASFVLCTETLEHVSKPDKLLREAARCLSPGGTIMLTVPLAARWHFIPYDYWRFTPSGLEQLLGEAGFRNIRVYARGNAVTVACYKAMALILRLALPVEVGILRRLACQSISLPFLPLLVLLSACANVSLLGKGGDDCLGYTTLAEKAL
jgi:SAM-dependent methyltransferase